MSEIVKCLVCGYSDVQKYELHDPVGEFYICPVCGRYEFTESEIMHPSLNMNKLGAYLYYNGFRKSKKEITNSRYYTTLSKEKCDEFLGEYDKGIGKHGRPVHIDNDIIESWYPKNFSDKVNMIMIRLEEIADYAGQEVVLSRQELCGLMFVERYSRITNERLYEGDLNRQISYFTKYLCEVGYINSTLVKSGKGFESITITPKGYQRIDELQKSSGEGKNVLVAMQFGDETKNLREAIKIGIRDAGFNPVLIDEVEHNELITPELLSYIRNSRFVVVDLTHQNNGAYFEEGYAMGLGKPVIQLCKKGKSLHFDIAQKNTIMWDCESDIPLRLKNRILATID